MTAIFISARGVVTPAGSDLSHIATCLRSNHSVLDKYRGRLMGRLDSQNEAQVSHLRAQKHLRDLDRAMLLGIMAAQLCKAQRGEGAKNFSDAGVVFGSSRGATHKLEDEHARFLASNKVGTRTSPLTTSGSFASLVSRELGCTGPSLFVSSACSTGLNALVVGASLLKANVAERMFVGASESCLTEFTFRQLDALNVYFKGDDYQPFSKQASGLVLAEGAGCVLLEQGKERDGIVVKGFASQSESESLTGISANGLALVAAIKQALIMAEVEAGDIDFIMAHGAGTKMGDASEMAAYGQVFGARLPHILASKRLYGHMLGASGMIEVALACEFLRELDVKTALVVGLGFGGSAAAAILQCPTN